MAPRKKPDESLIDEDENLKLYIAAKFELLHLEISHIREKTEQMDKNINTLSSSVSEIKTTQLMHYNECPNTTKVEELFFIKKNYKVFLAAGALALIIAIPSVIKEILDLLKYVTH